MICLMRAAAIQRGRREVGELLLLLLSGLSLRVVEVGYVLERMMSAKRA